MKPNIAAATPSVSSPLAALPTAKIVSIPRTKRELEVTPMLTPPDEETLKRLNKLASQFPFCIRHRSSNSPLL